MLIYTAGPYSADTTEGIAQNIAAAREAAIKLWDAGHVALCPHLNTAHFEQDSIATYGQYIDGDLNMLARCDAILMLEGWEKSKGASLEWDYASELHMPIYYYPHIPPLHPTEVRCPEQSKGFREIMGQMLRLHAKKNADYSPMNVLMTGEVGLITRLWDKTARLLSLNGFRAEISKATYTAPTEPANESIDDSYLDLAVYSVIGLLLRLGKWGK